VPSHAEPELVDLDLPVAFAPSHAWNGNLTHAVEYWYGDNGAAATHATPGDIDVVVVAVEESCAVGRGRGVLHLHGEPGAWVYGAALAEGVWYLVGVDGVKGGADANALLLSRFIDDDELGLLGFGDIAEEGEGVVNLGLGLRGNGVGAVGHGCSGIVHVGSHGSTAYGRVWWVITRVAGEDMTLSDILGGAMGDLGVCGGIPRITYRMGREKLASRFDRWAKMICDAKVTGT
jgi:hypothetical protein